MGAFSFNIACEMIDRFGYDPVAIRRFMDTLTSRTMKGKFTKFLATFDWDHDHVKVQQMKKKVLKQLEYAAIGRPFKTTTHLTY
jgi:predicted Zn-dependent protease